MSNNDTIFTEAIFSAVLDIGGSCADRYSLLV